MRGLQIRCIPALGNRQMLKIKMYEWLQVCRLHLEHE